MDAALLAVGFVARLSGFVVDRRIDDVVEHEVFLDLLDFGGARRSCAFSRRLRERLSGAGAAFVEIEIVQRLVVGAFVILLVVGGTRTCRQHRLLEQQGGHRAAGTAIAARAAFLLVVLHICRFMLIRVFEHLTTACAGTGGGTGTRA